MSASAAQARPPVTPDDVAKRVAHFRDLNFTPRGHLDTYIPGHERLIAAVIGPGAMEDPSHSPAIVAKDGFHVTYARCKPGNGNALHDHDTVEVFIALTGRWSIRYGAEAEHEVVLEQFDTISIPPGILRQFKNVSDQEAILLAIIGGTEAGHVFWPDTVIAEAAKNGARLDAEGHIMHA
jgi:uncharacterized RmlC-like cupin family protein